MENLIQQLKRRLFLVRGDGFDIDFHNYLYEGSYTRLHESLRDRRFTVGETDTSYRTINYWQSKGLLPAKGKDEGWRKFSFVELVWLKVIQRLRGYGVGVPDISKAVEVVMHFDKDLGTYPVFEYFIVKALVSSLDPYVFLLVADGKADVGSTSEFEAYKALFSSADAVLISLKAVLADLGLEPQKPDHLFALTSEEIQMLHAIRQGSNSAVTASLSRNGIKKIETLSNHSENPSFGDIDHELKESESFAELVMKYQKGRKESIQVKRVRKFN